MVNRRAPEMQALVSGAHPVGGPFMRWPRTADTVLAVAVFLLMALVTAGPDDDLVLRTIAGVSPAELSVYVVGSAALYWRRSQPLAVLATTLGATIAAVGLGYSELVGVSMMVAVYSVGRHASSDRRSAIGLGAVLAFVTISSLVDTAEVAEIGFGILLTLFVWYVGRQLRNRSEHAAQRERDRAAEARRTVAEERTRIARELHDVVAHRVSLMTVQAGAAKTIAADDPERASQAMHEVEKAGRQALDELRHLLGVLRPDADGDQLGPQPGLGDVARLVDQFRAAGLDVSLATDGEMIEVPARVDLSAYRIVQEALTNVFKHAGPGARTEVRVRTDHHGVAIEVSDNGRGATIVDGSGHGIVGMRERALLLGGSLDAAPRPGGGFRVTARLPIGEESA